MIQAIYPNLPIEDVKRSRHFFETLGLTFNEQFSDEKALGLTINDGASIMLLQREYFKTFTSRDIADPRHKISSMIALQLESRDAVDSMLKKALAAGGKEHREPSDLGFMYNRSFEDLDGHVWEVFHMDMSQMPSD